MMIIVVETLVLAVLYDAPAIGIMAVCGGLLTPVLLHSDQDLYVQFFSYLIVLNAGVIVLSLMRRWLIITTLALVGTQILFWSWYDESYFNPPETSKFWASILFQKGILAMYLVQMLLVHVWQKRRSGIEDLIRPGGAVLALFPRGLSVARSATITPGWERSRWARPLFSQS